MVFRSLHNVIATLLVALLVPLGLSGAGSPKKNGFRLSNTTYFHLGLGFITEYESNITQASDKSFVIDSNGTRLSDFVVQDVVLRIQPNTRLVVNDSYKTVGMSVFFDYDRYMGAEDSVAADKMSQLNLKSGILGEFNKEGNFVFSFKNNFARESAPRSQELIGYHSSLIERFSTSFHVRNSYRTLLLKITPGVEFRYFEEKSYKDYRYVAPDIVVYGRWNFLPKTAVFFNTSFRYQDYYESFMRDAVRSFPYNALVGLHGQFTPHFAMRISAGYAALFGEQSRHNITIGVELDYRRFDSTLLTLGYTRITDPAAFYQYIRNDRLYARLKQRFARIWLAQLDVSYSFVAYGKTRQFDDTAVYRQDTPLSWTRINLPNGASSTVEVSSLDRKVRTMRVKPALLVNATKWFGIKLDYEFRWDDTDYFRKGTYTDPANNVNTRYETYYDFMDHRVMLSLVLDY